MNTTEINVNANDYSEHLVKNNCRFIRDERLNKGDWLSLAKLTYLDQRGVPRIWEDATTTRLSRSDDTKIDSVGIIAFYKRQLHFDCIILLKQYRPALNAYTIEMPTGVIEDNESPEVAAIRELKECTGFSAIIKKIGPVLASDPGTSNCAMRLVTVEVNGDDPMNVYTNILDGNDRFKESVIIPVSELLDKLTAYAASGFIVDSRIDAFAIGLVMGNNSRKSKIPTTLV